MTTLTRIDLYRLHKDEYVQAKQPTLIDVGPAMYLAILGHGTPGGEEFQTAVEAIYGVAYTLKFASKKSGQDFRVPGFEGLWWTEGQEFSWGMPSTAWHYKLVMRVPDFVSAKHLGEAQRDLAAKKKASRAPEVRLEKISEGKCVQMLHVGPYNDEKLTVDAMEAYAASSGLEFYGPHHEIYLSDPRRVPPERIKTILRHSVRKTTRGGRS